MHEISPIRVGLKLCAELLHTLLKGVVKVVLIHIAHGHKTATLIADKMQIAHSDSARTDNSACQLITRRDIFLVAAHGSEHIAWQDREQRHSRRRLFQKTSSGFTHSAIVINEYPYVLTDSTNLHFLPLKLSIMTRQNAKKEWPEILPPLNLVFYVRIFLIQPDGRCDVRHGFHGHDGLHGLHLCARHGLRVKDVNRPARWLPQLC